MLEVVYLVIPTATVVTVLLIVLLVLYNTMLLLLLELVLNVLITASNAIHQIPVFHATQDTTIFQPATLATNVKALKLSAGNAQTQLA